MYFSPRFRYIYPVIDTVTQKKMFKPLTPAQFELEMADAKVQAQYRNNAKPVYTEPDGTQHRVEYFVNVVNGVPTLQWWCPPTDSKQLDPEY